MTLPANILVLAPHTDDGELGCGASLARYVKEGSRVSYAAFSLCRKSLPAGLPPDTLEKECRIATRELGIDEPQLFFFDFEADKYPTAIFTLKKSLLIKGNDKTRHHITGDLKIKEVTKTI